jgi:hypothetical protein
MQGSQRMHKQFNGTVFMFSAQVIIILPTTIPHNYLARVSHHNAYCHR